MNLKQWAKSAAPGDMYPYYAGFLLLDRDKQTYVPGVGYLLVNVPEVQDIANCAWALYEQGCVYLSQAKLGDGRYIYYATRASS